MQANDNIAQAMKAIEDYKFSSQVIEWFEWQVEKNFGIKLTDEQVQVIVNGFKDYFTFLVISPEPVAIPSKLVDELWHTFILHTSEYSALAEQMGQYIHHYPILVKRVFGDKTDLVDIEFNEHYQSIIRAYCLSCQASGFDPQTTTEIPYLFRVDSILPPEHATLFDIQFFQSVLGKLGIHNYVIEE